MVRAGLRTAGLMMVLLASLAAPVLANTGEIRQYAVDRGASTVGFTVSAKAIFTLKRDGTFHEFAGSVDYDPSDPAATRVDLTVYTASVDLKNADHEDLMRSEEFFDVGHHPTMHFVSTAVRAVPGGGLEVTGDLTIRGVTRHLVVPMQVLNRAGGSGQPAFETRFQIDRTEFGLNGGGTRAKGFNVSIGKRVDIHLAIAASKTPAAR